MIERRRILQALSVLIIAAGIFTSSACAAEKRPSVVNDPTGFSILEAGEKGMFNMGPAMGDVTGEREELIDKNILKFDYTIYGGAIAGVWTKSFPSRFSPKMVDAVRASVKASTPEQLKQVSVKLEIKGKGTMQAIPMRLTKDWSYINEAVDWDRIGPLNEVVFVVSPLDPNKKLEGILYFDLEFFKMSFLQKYLALIKVSIVLLVGFLAALIMALFGRISARKKEDGSPVSGIKRDLLYGVSAVLILGTGISVYAMGIKGALDAGLGVNFVIVALLGAGIAQILKYGLTGKSLTGAETLRNVLVSGFLAAASSRMELLQPPSSWVQLLTFSNTVAALTFIIYHAANARSLASSGKQLRPISSILIAGVPYLFNWLLLVESPGLLHTLGNALTLGIWKYWSIITENVGRLIIIFGFNEAVANGIGISIRERPLKTFRAHLSVFLVSMGVVVAPLIADFGSTAAVASLPAALKAVACIITSMLSFGGLWAEVYLITGMLLDSGKLIAPSGETLLKHVNGGMKKGMAFSAIVMGILFVLNMIIASPVSQKVMGSVPMLIGIIAGALIFPFLKTIIESFDGSLPFFERTRYSYRDLSLYARGAIVGFGFSYAMSKNMITLAMPNRIVFGLIIGILSSGGVSFLRDAFYAFKGTGRVHTWKLYFVDSVLGAFIGSAAAFYMDALQVPVIVEKFKLYVSSGFEAVNYVTYPLVNKWGRIDLGTYTGGVKLIYTESLAGVINWSIAAWLFAINKVFMQAYFEKDKTPIKFFFSKAGFAQLVEHMIYVLRWGLWMSPIIFTGLRMMPDPTWYNQDGAIRTGFAIFNNITMSPEAFRAWSLQVFIWIMACDFFRVLIWMDHMGLRVATLVNLSFLGLDRLDERIARFIGPAAAQRYIPDAVKRFATWAPLLIPFYIPRGNEWDKVWNTSIAMQNAAMNKPGLIATFQSMPVFEKTAVIIAAVIACTVFSVILRALHHRKRSRTVESHELANREYRVIIRDNGEIFSEGIHKECDVTRRAYDPMDPCGRILFLVDKAEKPESDKRFWPVVGNFPKGKFDASKIEKRGDSFRVANTSKGIRTNIKISLPDKESNAEIWEVTLENTTDKARELKVVPYLEWVLVGGIHDRFHTQYARLYPEMEYVSSSNAVLAYQKSAKTMGILASDAAPEGFLTSRVDFIGRVRSIWSPRILETLNFLTARDTNPYPTFDPIGSLAVNAQIAPKASVKVRFMIGFTKNKKTALELIAQHLKPQSAAPKAKAAAAAKKASVLIGHGEIPPGTPQPYSTFSQDGKKLVVHTPFTPRPIDHAVSNAVHSIMVTNRGLHTSSNGNSQQNRLTPDWPDIVTKEIPTEAFYLYDPDGNDWYSPTYLPLRDKSARCESEFSVDGTAIFRMARGSVSTELTVFVPPDDPAGLYLLTVKNNSDRDKKLRIVPYFQMVLGFQPERAGPLMMKYQRSTGSLFFNNPRNIFRSGWAFVSTSMKSPAVETSRGKFFGCGGDVVRPYMVKEGSSDRKCFGDISQVAAFLEEVTIPAHGEHTMSVVMGQCDDRKEADKIIRKYKNVDEVRKSLAQTKKWWLGLMDTLKVETNKPEFDRYQDWLKYQALAERIWARRGFYQTSGAYGFRDQLQDTVNLIWVDPALARKQIILHASQQFIEGDVFHWFFTLTDGRTAFSCRSHASDNPVWLVWGVVEYIRTTGDTSILDEMASYVISQFPFAKLPKNKQGWGHLYHRTTRSDTIYKHCMKSVDLILKDRTGKNGLPLIQTGDWNDGLDEIGSEGKGESVWLGFFLYYILKEMVNIIEMKEGKEKKAYYVKRMEDLKTSLEKTWRGDRYLRAFHDDGTEIGIKGSGVWEIDALTASWAVKAGINFERGLTVFNTALDVLERENAILLGWPALREDTKPYLGRSSKYPEGVRENGMYCHGVQWLVRAARLIAEEFDRRGDRAKADEYRKTSYRLWLKVSPIPRVKEVELYGGQPNKQSADILTTFDQGRMIWHGYTGAAGWMLRQAMEGVLGASLAKNKLVLPDDIDKPRGELKISRIQRDITKSPIKVLRPG
ncbi:MAG: hypothetical protein PHI58_01220 [Candidatus Omnitrophica bacterium]|nr:hypothetical protein [Candidatus Omnitrophota bacterium]